MHVTPMQFIIEFVYQVIKAEYQISETFIQLCQRWENACTEAEVVLINENIILICLVSQRGNILIKVEFTKNVIWRPQDIDFSFERTQ